MVSCIAGRLIGCTGRRAGQAMVEFASIASLLFLLVFAILEFGRGFYYYNAVVNAAQEGARYGVTDQNVACVKAAALSKAVAVGISDSDITVSCPDGCAFGKRINVVVNFAFNPVVALIPGFPIEGNSTMRIGRANNTGGACY